MPPSLRYLFALIMLRCSRTWCTVALLGLLCSSLGSLLPRKSFSIGSPSRLLAQFNRSDTGNTTTLLLSDDGNTLFVGGRDAVLSLDVSNPGVMELRKKLTWKPSPNDLNSCNMRSKQKRDCHNFIRVLQFLNATHMYTCGTFAFSPHCAYIDVPMFTLYANPEQAKGRCPFNPYRRNTAVVVDGELYVGTMEDYWENQPAISRYLSHGSRADLKLDSVPGWLEDPTFVNSIFIPSEKKVYYFLTEVNTEYTFGKKFLVSRIAQVCTNDMGGERILQKRWTTFAKAQLLCQSEGDLPFNILQDIVILSKPDGSSPDEVLFYGIFSSQWSLTSGQSAVCVFRLNDIKKVFSGEYLQLNRNTMRWTSKTSKQTVTPGVCGLHSASDSTLSYVKENFLAKDSVKSLNGLVLVSPDQHYSRIAAQRTQAANGRNFTVLYLLSESGFLHKVVLLEKGPHIIEEVQVFTQPQSVKNIVLSITKGVVFVGSSEGVFQLSVSNCSFYWNCIDCVLARDPFCGWDPAQSVCTEWSNSKSTVWQDLEKGNVTTTCGSVQTRKSKSGLLDHPRERKNVIENEIVELHCPKSSNLALLYWERADGHQLSKHIYLQLDHGNIRFPATSQTVGDYNCISLENSHREILARITVKLRASPRSFISNNVQGNEVNRDSEYIRETENLTRTANSDSGCFRKMVAVSVLLAVTLFLLVVVGLYVWHVRTRAKPATVACPQKDIEMDLHEQDPLTTVKYNQNESTTGNHSTNHKPRDSL
ncbi:semaphorin-4A-like [Scleropages formosus]|uniref:Semaphorin-4A-like n=1 Tax=Scleropages formosus TaxID=113540 RepID=A0A8C9RGU8_SCLFO|nr:semaphorin-4A-like [Scleropages formosus]XP_018620279.2 semaphorin-4A-like [Scleropages formosus]XP_018620281.2 semaphorin-4A-like [Scleropages formosus]